MCGHDATVCGVIDYIVRHTCNKTIERKSPIFQMETIFKSFSAVLFAEFGPCMENAAKSVFNVVQMSMSFKTVHTYNTIKIKCYARTGN